MGLLQDGLLTQRGQPSCIVMNRWPGPRSQSEGMRRVDSLRIAHSI